MSRGFGYRRVLIRDNRWGVSEVVGSVLLLLMTVAVFSGIILFVNSIQGPGDKTFVDLVPSLQRASPDSGTVSITHAGGNALVAVTTSVIIQVNTSRYVFDVADGLDPQNGEWVTGQVWSFFFASPGLPDVSTVQVTVVDRANNQVVLLAVVQRGIGDGAAYPIIGTMAVIPNGSVFNSGNDPFKIRVVAVDYDYDLPSTGVHVDLSPLGCAVANQDLQGKGFGVFESPNYSTIPPCVAQGTYLVNVTATDLGGHQSKVAFQFIVKKAPVPPDFVNWTGGGGPFGLPFSSEFQAYEIYNATEWAQFGFNGTGTRQFVKGETVVVVLASQYIKNTDLQNDIYLYSSTSLPVKPIVFGNAPYNDPVTSTSLPSTHDGFQFFEFTSGFFIWIYSFPTDSSTLGFNGVQLDYGHYSLDMAIRASAVAPPKNRFATVDYLDITNETGDIREFPKLEFFKDRNYTAPSNTFRFTDILYAQITVNGTNSGPTVGPVVISDYVGNSPIWAVPGVTPVSDVKVPDSTHYRFAVDLSSPNQDAWIFGTNAYGFRVMQVIDDDEAYSLDTQVIVQGPEWALDVIAGINEYAQQVHSQKWYSTFYKNDAQWARTLVEYFDSAPSATTPEWGGGPFLSAAAGDLDQDGDLDAVFGTEAGPLFMYRNNGGLGTSWTRFQMDTLTSPVTAVAIGRINIDIPNDLVIGTRGGEVWLYTNDGRWTPSLIATMGALVVEVRIADINGDNANDVVVATSGGNVVIYRNNGYGGFGTQVTTDYGLASESSVQGVLSGTYAALASSDDTYQAIREVNGSAEEVTAYPPIGEIVPAYGQIVSGSYANTLALDGAPYEVLAESFYDGPGSLDYWLLRNSTAGAMPGHMYTFGNIPSLGGGDTARLTINGFLSSGTESFEIRYKVGSGSPSAVLGNISSSSPSTQSFALTGFSGGELYVIIQDTDISKNDASSDGKQTQVAIDFLVVEVTRLNGTTSRLEHKWITTTIGTGGDGYKVFIEAHHTPSSDGDNFRLQYSTTSTGPWTDLITIVKTSDNNAPQQATLPVSVGGTVVYFRIVDTNRTQGGTSFDTIVVDHLFVRRFVTVPNSVTINVGTAISALQTGDVNGDGHRDVVVGTGTNVKVYYGSGFASVSTIAASGTVTSVDVGLFDNGTTMDIAVGTATGNLDIITQPSIGSFSRTTVGAFGSSIHRIRAGDVDDDLWDDVVVATADGRVIWLRHNRGSTWDGTVIEDLGTAIYDIAIGDFQRGKILSY